MRIMNKYLIALCFSIGLPHGCELMSGVNIPNPYIDQLFTKAQEKYVSDPDALTQIEGLYSNYVCQLAAKDPDDTRDIETSIVQTLTRMLGES
jgi:hypothetical protein